MAVGRTQVIRTRLPRLAARRMVQRAYVLEGFVTPPRVFNALRESAQETLRVQPQHMGLGGARVRLASRTRLATHALVADVAQCPCAQYLIEACNQHVRPEVLHQVVDLLPL